MQDNNQNIEAITLEARKAYRYLFQYQQRILDLVRFIGGSLGLEYQGGYPKFSNPAPRNGGGNLYNWAWDWLNMYFYEFRFKKKESDVKFSAFIVNDTGFYENDKISKLDVKEYRTVEESQTKLILVAGINLCNASSTPWDEWQLNKFLNENLVEERNGGIMLSKIYSLGSFATEEDAIRSLVEFCEYCRNNEIPIFTKESIAKKDEANE